MKPKEIKAELIRRGVSLREIALLANCPPSQVSMCINGDGLYQTVREVVSVKLEKPVKKIFNTNHPKPKRKQRTFTVV